MAATSDLRITLRAIDQASGPIGAVNKALSGLGAAAAAPGKAIGGLMAGLGKLGLAGLGIQAVVGAAKGLGDVMGVNVNNSLEQARAGINAFTKDAGKTEEILGMVRDRAAATPFSFQEMATAAGSLMPIMKSTGISLEDLIQNAEILAASNPMEGLAGASFSLREAMTGDFTSIIERFNLSRSSINQWKEEGVSNFEIVQRAMAEMGFDADLVAAKSETLEGRWSTFNDTLDTFKATAGESLFAGLKEGLIFLQGAFDANKESIMGFAESISDGIGNAITIAKALFVAFTDDAGAMGVVLDTLRAQFGDDFANAMQPFIQGFMEAIPAMQSFADMLVGGFQASINLFVALVTGDFVGATNVLLARCQEVAGELVPILASWGVALSSWVAPATGPMLAELNAAITQMTAMLVSEGPNILTALMEWGQQFALWVGPALTQLLFALPTIIGGLTGWIIGVNVQIYSAILSNWVPRFLEWTNQVAGQIPSSMGQIGAAIIAYVFSIGPQLNAAASTLAGNFISGLTGGISAGMGSVRAAGASAATATLNSAAAAAGAESPATEWIKLGKDLLDGLAIGIEENTFDAVDSAQTLIDKLAEVMREGGISEPVIEEMGNIVRAIEDASASVERESKKLERLRKDAAVDKLFNEDPKMLEFRQRQLELDKQMLDLQERMAPAVKARKQAELELKEVREQAAKNLKPLEEALDKAREEGAKKAVEAAQRALEAVKNEGQVSIDLAQAKLDAAEEALKPFEEQKEQLGEVQDALDLERDKFDLLREAVEITSDAIIEQQQREVEFHKAAIEAGQESAETLRDVKQAAEEAAAALEHVGVPEDVEGRAAGGSVFGGNTYMVGERGPELFVPGRSGMIVPNNMLGGLVGIQSVNITINGSGDPGATARAVRDELVKLSRRNGGSAFGGTG